MTDPARTTVSITLNGRTIEATPGELLIEAAERAGTYIPRFCYHPRMEPVGVCRMCLVEVDGPRGATLQPSCYLKVNDGMVVTTDSEKVKKVHDGVLELLLTNHPLDCPVCDKGGECPLQDQTLAHGPGETRFVEEKRHWVKPIEIGELILLDRERCIQCARCTRFADEVAGDAQIAFASRGDHIEVAPSPTQPFDSVFSGNVVQICPVGALTAKPYRFAARPWDLEQVESTCANCAVGCRVAVQSSQNRLTRVLGVDSDPVNHGWLCDKGRFSLDSIDQNESSTDLLDASTRVTEPLVRRDGELRPASWSEALRAAATSLRDASQRTNGVGAIGGAALTNEGAFAWERFVRGVLASEHLDAQFGDGLDAQLVQALPTATIDEAVDAPVVVTLTGDLREELPVLFLRLREAFVKHHHALVEFAFGASALRSLARVSLAVRPGEAHLVAAALAGQGAAHLGAAFSESELAAARALLGERGEGVVFVVGRPNVGEGAAVLESAIRTLAERYPDARFLSALRRSNVRGALDMGLAPGLRPGRGVDVGVNGRDALAQLDALVTGEQRAVLLLGAGLLGNVLDAHRASVALETGDVILVTGHGGPELAFADVVLPAAVQHERSGTITNIEGRVTAVTAKVSPPGSAWNDVAIAAELAEEFGQSLGLRSPGETAKAIEETTGYPALSVLNDARTDGVVVGRVASLIERRPMDPMAFPGIRSAHNVGLASHGGDTALLEVNHTGSTTPVTLGEVVAGRGVDVPLVDAYSLRVNVSRRLYDRGVAMQGSPALAGLVGATALHVHHSDLDRLGASTGDVVAAHAGTTTVELPVVADDAVPRGVAEVAFATLTEDGRDAIRSLVEHGALLTLVRLESR
ncbi:MAG TPA: NADH-quinone oxidoreductase subunit NuoG [Acidimicrobiales bacterium]|nr:NADH-quinone oxidoreductase subunit NuoG [Acidimicrobiales bacterium]